MVPLTHTDPTVYNFIMHVFTKYVGQKAFIKPKPVKAKLCNNHVKIITHHWSSAIKRTVGQSNISFLQCVLLLQPYVVWHEPSSLWWLVMKCSQTSHRKALLSQFTNATMFY